VLCASAGIVVCTNGFSTYAALHLVDGAETWRSWMYTYPFAAVAIVATAAMVAVLRTMPWRRWPWTLVAVGAYVVWALLSTIWSVDRDTTWPAATIGVGIAAFGCWFGWRLRAQEQIWAVVLATGVISVASALVVWRRPEYGKMILPPEVFYFVRPWQGIFANRNSLAPVCVLGLVGVVGFVLSRVSVLRVLIALPLGVVHVVLLRNSGGITSQITLVLIACTAVALPGVWFLRSRRVPGAAVAGMAVAGVATAWFVLFAKLDRFTHAVGREANLSNRRLIWADVRRFVADRPIGGHGYWAFWERADLTAATYSRLNSAYASAHSSALEVLLGLGLIGFIAFLVIVFAAVAGVLRWAWSERSIASWWWSILLVFLVTQNLLESFVLWHSYVWVLIVAAAMVPFGRRDLGTEESLAVERSAVTPLSDDHEDLITERIPAVGASSSGRRG